METREFYTQTLAFQAAECQDETTLRYINATCENRQHFDKLIEIAIIIAGPEYIPKILEIVDPKYRHIAYMDKFKKNARANIAYMSLFEFMEVYNGAKRAFYQDYSYENISKFSNANQYVPKFVIYKRPMRITLNIYAPDVKTCVGKYCLNHANMLEFTEALANEKSHAILYKNTEIDKGVCTIEINGEISKLTFFQTEHIINKTFEVNTFILVFLLFCCLERRDNAADMTAVLNLMHYVNDNIQNIRNSSTLNKEDTLRVLAKFEYISSIIKRAHWPTVYPREFLHILPGGIISY